MTWVVAKSFVTGYVAVLSDVQVTWNNGGIRKDCLKKVYPVAPNMVAGFSGSIDIGFCLLNDLANFIQSKSKSNEHLMPRSVGHGWHRRAKKIFELQPKNLRKLGVQILLAGTSPKERTGDLNVDRTDIVVISNKNSFKPSFIPQMKTASIGSGSSFDSYINFMNDADGVDNMSAFLNAETKFGGAGENFAFMASIHMQSNQMKGVSKMVHCTLVSTNDIRQFPLDFNTYKGEEKIEHRMPKVCENYVEFLAYEKKLRLGTGNGFG